jgi:phthalate 4,5-dioxygenase oxygenase subunit
MLSKEDNELLTRVDGDAPMGRLMRNYWLPVYRAEDLEAGGAPRPVSVVGEKLVVFRDHAGKVGVLDESCPHRGASLTLARNVDCSLQCLYHGWRIAADGRVVETPSESEDATFKTKVRQVAYPVREAGGLIWTYLGQPGTEPEFPAFGWTGMPAGHTFTMRVRLEYNWAQALEGAVDSAHVSFLHTDYVARLAKGEDAYEGGGESLLDKAAVDGHPKLEVENTPYGFRYGALRRATVDGEAKTYVRVTHFVAPVWGVIPTRKRWAFAQAFVPCDDKSTMFYFVLHRSTAPFEQRERDNMAAWNGLDDVDENFALRNRTPANLWGQDRAAMTAGMSYSGLGGYPPLEDIAVQESMGPIYDRTREHLGTSDLAVIRMRRIMLGAARALGDGSKVPPALGGGFDYSLIKADEALIDPEESWKRVGNAMADPASAR